jgi:hypothetical protein
MSYIPYSLSSTHHPPPIPTFSTTPLCPTPQPQLPPLTMATPAMPACGHSTTPKFEGNNARELHRYFNKIEHLFTQCTVNDNNPKKFLVHHVDIDTKDSWRQIAEFGNVLSTYEELKNTILKLYPGADGKHTWTFEDLDNLTGQWAQRGICHKEDLGDYHRKFLVITTLLKCK